MEVSRRVQSGWKTGKSSQVCHVTKEYHQNSKERFSRWCTITSHATHTCMKQPKQQQQLSLYHFLSFLIIVIVLSSLCRHHAFSLKRQWRLFELSLTNTCTYTSRLFPGLKAYSSFEEGREYGHDMTPTANFVYRDVICRAMMFRQTCEWPLDFIGSKPYFGNSSTIYSWEDSRSFWKTVLSQVWRLQCRLWGADNG